MIECIDAGLVRYADSELWQQALAEKRRCDEIPDSVLFLEHYPPVFTMGRRDSSSDLKVSRRWIHQQGIEIHKTDRGGRVTYHGPGQLVGYLIFRLKDSIPELVWKIEETLLLVLHHFHVRGERDSDYPGIWIGKNKIAALGLRIDRGVTRHGFALNVNCDLRPFEAINPCGVIDRGVTSLEKELGWRPPMRDVKHLILDSLSRVFETSVSSGGSVYQESE